jgi:hypothetical protein
MILKAQFTVNFIKALIFPLKFIYHAKIIFTIQISFRLELRKNRTNTFLFIEKKSYLCNFLEKIDVILQNNIFLSFYKSLIIK